MTKIEYYQYFLANTQWLYFKIYQNEWFFFDLWSVVHFGSGVVFYLLINSLFKKYVTQIFVGILVFYELFEIFLLYFMVRIILPETFNDQFTDIVIGLIGGFCGKQYLSLSIGLKPFVRLFFISCVFGYLLIGVRVFLPEIIQNKILNFDVGLIFKVFIFSYLILLLSDLLIEKFKIKGWVLFIIGSFMVISSVAFFRFVSLPYFDFNSLILYASIIILANRLILYLVNQWEARKKYSISNYYFNLFRRFRDWPIK